jgi:hypothetical protein
MRRYKYLEKMHEEEMNKILVYLKGFTEEERKRLAQVIYPILNIFKILIGTVNLAKVIFIENSFDSPGLYTQILSVDGSMCLGCVLLTCIRKMGS